MYCANHPDVETLLRCNRCGKPICLKCATLTDVGYRCNECIRSVQDTYFNAKSSDNIVAFSWRFLVTAIDGPDCQHSVSHLPVLVHQHHHCRDGRRRGRRDSNPDHPPGRRPQTQSPDAVLCTGWNRRRRGRRHRRYDAVAWHSAAVACSALPLLIFTFLAATSTYQLLR